MIAEKTRNQRGELCGGSSELEGVQKESWKPHLPNSLTMGSKDTSSQEQQREAK
jgi:hypothetical protein